ncbi:NCS2 family permease [Bacteroides sp. OttesenSCG-928-D19]|nr:NCS2 family permease [Bacteroides sp. OttesenSCG-928-D19]
MLEKLFGFTKKHNLRIEILAGITTFLTMAYILAVNPSILSATGMDKGALFTSTVIASVIATLLMAILAKLPFALAPGMGLNAFFAYTVCLTMGYSWQFALTAVLIEGLIFIILTLTNLREAIVNLLPETIKKSISAGIGLFIAFIGLQNAEIIVNNDATLISLGNITSGAPMLGLVGLLITSILLIRKVKGALLIGILATTIIGIPLGITQYTGIFSVPPSIEPIFFQYEFHNIFTKDMVIIVFTFLFVDMFDTIGTLVGVSTKANMLKNGKIPNARMAFLADAIGTTIGSAIGTSTVTTFVESAAGVGEGGRTGLTSFVTALCFLLALFFAPLFLSIPGAATAPALILVGLMMLTPIKEVDLHDFSEAIPAFLCIIFMPLAYSISDGIVLGMISYVIINLLCGRHKKLSIGMYIIAALFILKYFI